MIILPKTPETEVTKVCCFFVFFLPSQFPWQGVEGILSTGKWLSTVRTSKENQHPEDLEKENRRQHPISIITILLL